MYSGLCFLSVCYVCLFSDRNQLPLSLQQAHWLTLHLPSLSTKTHALVLADQAVGLGGDRGRRIRSGHDSCGDTSVWQETAPCQLHAATPSGLEELWLETSPQAKSGAGLRPQDRTL